MMQAPQKLIRQQSMKSGRASVTIRVIGVVILISGLVWPLPAHAQSPWETAVNILRDAFTTTIARGLSLVAIVVAGLVWAFNEGESKRMLAGVLFGVSMAVAAVNFLNWLFP